MAKLSVVVPAYNERATIVALLTKLRAINFAPHQTEILVVDDGSTDGTRQELRNNPSLFDRLIERDKNGGKGAAVRDGIQAATGEWVAFQDADLEYDPAALKSLFEEAVLEPGTVVLGSRFLDNSDRRASYWGHRAGNWLITRAFNRLNGTHLTDAYTCYLVFPRKMIDAAELRTNGFEQQAELLTLLASRAKRFIEIPISYQGRSQREGKKIRARHMIAVLSALARGRLRTLRGHS